MNKHQRRHHDQRHHTRTGDRSTGSPIHVFVCEECLTIGTTGGTPHSYANTTIMNTSTTRTASSTPRMASRTTTRHTTTIYTAGSCNRVHYPLLISTERHIHYDGLHNNNNTPPGRPQEKRFTVWGPQRHVPGTPQALAVYANTH